MSLIARDERADRNTAQRISIEPAACLFYLFTIAAVGVVAYLPVVDNFFISDDFTLLQTLEVLSVDPLRILEMPSELFRVVSYVFFWTCLQFFGLNSEPYYWAGIALHVTNSILVFALVLTITRGAQSAWVAGIFFAAYERHHEAVMWISAFNDSILALSCLIFLLLWERTLTRPHNFKSQLGVYAAFAVALFSKEAAVALVPLAGIRLLYSGQSLRQVFQRLLPLVIMLGVFVAIWLSQANRNFFVADGHYELGWHFLPVYLRSTFRLLTPVLLFVLPLAFLALRGAAALPAKVSANRSAVFFLALVLLSVVPYSFLTYLDHIPSRNTYFPSVGLAGLMGLAFVQLSEVVHASRTRWLVAAFLGAIVIGNVSYIWLKKEPQFLERAAPTTELIAVLNGLDPESSQEQSISVCEFPLHEWIGQETVRRFTAHSVERVRFLPRCEGTEESVALNWDELASTFHVKTTTASAPDIAPQPEVED